MATTDGEIARLAKNIHDLRDAITNHQLANTAVLTQISDKLNILDKGVTETRVLLNGNGQPEKGLVMRFDRVERTTAFQNKVLWVVFTVLFGVIATAWMTSKPQSEQTQVHRLP